MEVEQFIPRRRIAATAASQQFAFMLQTHFK
jgi:hypothetical protein